tara:strand:- start:81 stop:410 length:330 start_codon:yes stop_codon:yes gene_type:complete
MEPYQFGMITGEVTNVDDAIDKLDRAWDNLDKAFDDCSDDSFNTCEDLKTKQTDYFKKYHDYNSKLEGSNELSGQYKELNDKALMRPINISFGIMILLALISDLTVGFE